MSFIALSKKKNTSKNLKAWSTNLKSKTNEEISKATGGFGIPGFKWPL